MSMRTPSEITRRKQGHAGREVFLPTRVQLEHDPRLIPQLRGLLPVALQAGQPFRWIGQGAPHRRSGDLGARFREQRRLRVQLLRLAGNLDCALAQPCGQLARLRIEQAAPPAGEAVRQALEVCFGHFPCANLGSFAPGGVLSLPQVGGLDSVFGGGEVRPFLRLDDAGSPDCVARTPRTRSSSGPDRLSDSSEEGEE